MSEIDRYTAAAKFLIYEQDFKTTSFMILLSFRRQYYHLQTNFEFEASDFKLEWINFQVHVDTKIFKSILD